MKNPYKKSLFWDVDTENLSAEKDWYFIIERILEFGDINDLFWMKKTFAKEKIEETVRKSRILSPRTLSYYKVSGYAS
ncbi:MAG: hypothetical protein A2X59_05805 [Nitrospirae bacterium GWC2_42_7]|nr:MAG: hypothetical protein A2X59_05805 [Nitrospirae bacterium GWC2_42_7]